MYISVMFKDRNKVFRGVVYDYELHPEEAVPPVGSIVRMLDSDYEYICNGTRVKVVEVKDATLVATPTVVRVIETDLND